MNMNRLLIGVGVFGIVFLMVSSATAVPQTQSKPLMSHIEKIEAVQASADVDIELLEDLGTKGLFDFLIALINLLIQFVYDLIQIVQKITSLVSLIQSLIEAVLLLFSYISQLIELILSIFNPQQTF